MAPAAKMKPLALLWIFIALCQIDKHQKAQRTKRIWLQVRGNVKAVTQASKEQGQTNTDLVIDRSMKYVNVHVAEVEDTDVPSEEGGDGKNGIESRVGIRACLGVDLATST
jgi:hypothetical protein